MPELSVTTAAPPSPDAAPLPMNLSALLVRYGACDASIIWVRNSEKCGMSIRDMWDVCPNGFWIEWLLCFINTYAPGLLNSIDVSIWTNQIDEYQDGHEAAEMLREKIPFSVIDNAVRSEMDRLIREGRS